MGLALLRPLEAARRCGISRSQLYELRARGQFPRAVPITKNTIGFLESEVDGWIQTKVDAARATDKEELHHEVE